jgi:hypothetical protein
VQSSDLRKLTEVVLYNTFRLTPWSLGIFPRTNIRVGL